MIKQQVIFIHWWTSNQNYKDSFDCLHQLEYKPFKVNKKWHLTLKEDLGDKFELYNPDMPNKFFADYQERKIMFEKTFPFLKDNIILVWHSLGGSFLTKYLNENIFPVTIKHIFLISSAFQDCESEVLWNFNFDQNLEKLKQYEKIITFYHSLDDTIIPFSDLEAYRKQLPFSDYKIFSDRCHFVNETFPELIRDIKNI